MLLVGENNATFGDQKDDLSNSYLLGNDKYPQNREGLVRILNTWKRSKKKQSTTKTTTTVKDEVVFVQREADSDKKNGKRVKAERAEQCQHCRKKDGHCINECPDLSHQKMYQNKKDSTE